MLDCILSGSPSARLQLARDYARERLQGRDATGAQRPIIEHADVRRMLLMMKSSPRPRVA